MMYTFLLMTGMLISPSVALMTLNEFNNYILGKCYKIVNHEIVEYADNSKPLANTLDNFINLVEKLELANPNVELSTILLYLLKNYTIDNLKYQNKFMVEKLPGSEFYFVEKMWEEERRNPAPRIEDPLDDDEKCALYFMLSYTIDKSDKKNTDLTTLLSSVVSQRDFDGLLYNDDNNFALSPREQGVVAIHNSEEHAVAMSRVIIGLYQGLKEQMMKTFQELGKETPGETVEIYPLYALTLSDVLVVSQWTVYRKEFRGLGSNGKWKPSEKCKKCPQNGNPCPLTYLLPDRFSSAITYSAVRGGADGLILGLAAKKLRDHRAKLSQILRMYYSPRGVPYQENEFTSKVMASYCTRMDLINEKMGNILENMRKYERLIVQDRPDRTLVDEASSEFNNKKDDILNVKKNGNSECSENKNTDSTDITHNNFRCETPTDVFVVLDTSTDSMRLEDQQLTTGLIASNMDLWQGGGSMSVYLDQRNRSGELLLSPIVFETHSSAKAACYSTQFDLSTVKETREQEDFLIRSLDKLIEDMKTEHADKNGVPGKVVVYFNFAEELPKNDYRLDSVVKAFHLEHQDVSIYAVGNNRKVLKKYAVGDIDLIIAAESTPSEMAKQLQEKICEVPASFQYKDCTIGSSESSAVYEGTVTPDHIQYWMIDPKYFHKSFTLKITLEVIDGRIIVCSNRANSRPDLQKANCNITDKVRPFEMKITNPCQGNHPKKCAPVYFSVIGLKADNGEKDTITTYCQENDNTRCKTLDQIKFKMTHEGMRCSGCLGLLSTPLVLFFSCILVYFFT